MAEELLQSASRFIAIDIHKHYLMVGGIDTSKQVVLQPRRVDLHRWEQWARLHLRDSDQVVLEATTNAWLLYDLLITQVARVVVAHPARMRLVADARVKTDRVDVLTLANLLRADLLPEVWVPPTHVRELRAALASPAPDWAANHGQEPPAERAAPSESPSATRATMQPEEPCVLGRTQAVVDRAPAS